MSKLTLRTLTEAKPNTTLSDPSVEGLRYRVRASGKIFAELRYKLGGKWQSVPLGRVYVDDRLHDLTGNWHPLDPDRPERPYQPSVNEILEPWHEAARELRRKVRAGHDPRGGARPDSLKALIDDYLRHAVVRPRTRTERERHLLRDWAPFHARAAASLTKGEIAAHLLKLKADHGSIASNRSRATLRAMFSWAADIGRIEDVPPFPPKVLKQEPTRERELTLDELRAIWAATAGDADYNVIVRLLLLTGQRREEVGGMRWSELDLDRALWSLPGERTKNKRPHVVPLSAQAVELIKTRTRKPDRDQVFGDRGTFSAWTHGKRRLDKRCGVADWRLHDLRHAWSTHVHELGVAPHVVEAAINHLSGFKSGVAGRYNRAQYMPERTRAMQLWADHLLQSEPAKVVPIRA